MKNNPQISAHICIQGRGMFFLNRKRIQMQEWEIMRCIEMEMSSAHSQRNWLIQHGHLGQSQYCLEEGLVICSLCLDITVEWLAHQSWDSFKGICQHFFLFLWFASLPNLRQADRYLSFDCSCSNKEETGRARPPIISLAQILVVNGKC